MVSLTNLPNELLLQILTYIPSLDLLPLLPLSLHIHTLILDIIHRRIRTAIALQNYYLMLECCPFAEVLNTDILHCEYVGTWRRSDAPLPTTSTTTTASSSSTTPQSTPIGSLYCHFRPFVPNFPTTTLSFGADTFLTVQVCLIKGGPLGLFTSAIVVFEKTIYVDRPWFTRAAERTVELFGACETPFEQDTREGASVGVGDAGEEQDRILWISDGLAGLKLCVRESTHIAPNFTYSLNYEQLLVNTVHLLLMLEKSWEEQLAHRGEG